MPQPMGRPEQGPRRPPAGDRIMPKRTDISSILIIGAGPIVIGQACEFDYSGTQACKALKEEGYRIIMVNSNPATIMTDPDLADATYVEPITRSEEHTSELQSLMRISYAGVCLKQKKKRQQTQSK